MERAEKRKTEPTELNGDVIVQGLGLVLDKNDNNFFQFKPSFVDRPASKDVLNTESLGKPEELQKYFPGIKLVDPDSVCRPTGDTTFFTSAGFQHLETLMRENTEVDGQSFLISQPVIRSQFMDKVKEGTSSSFINFSIESVGANPSEFITLSNQFIELLEGLNINKEDVRFQIESKQDKWGGKKFTKTVWTTYIDGVEVGEGVYIHDYPITQEVKVPIADIGFGIERVNWVIGAEKHYFSEFSDYYDKADEDTVASVIDPIRTMVLIAGEGIKPSSHDQGYRLRQLSKRFVQRNLVTNFHLDELVIRSSKFWEQWGYRPTLDGEELLDVIRVENERNYNGLFLETLQREEGSQIYVDINQPTSKFFNQLEFSLPKQMIDTVTKKLK